MKKFEGVKVPRLDKPKTFLMKQAKMCKDAICCGGSLTLECKECIFSDANIKQYKKWYKLNKKD